MGKESVREEEGSLSSYLQCDLAGLQLQLSLELCRLCIRCAELENRVFSKSFKWRMFFYLQGVICSKAIHTPAKEYMSG